MNGFLMFDIVPFVETFLVNPEPVKAMILYKFDCTIGRNNWHISRPQTRNHPHCGLHPQSPHVESWAGHLRSPFLTSLTIAVSILFLAVRYYLPIKFLRDEAKLSTMLNYRHDAEIQTRG
jgi:hypothetical protein